LSICEGILTLDKLEEFFNNHVDEAARYNFENVETIEEKQLIALLMIRNNLKRIGGWVQFFGIIAVISLVISILLGSCI